MKPKYYKTPGCKPGLPGSYIVRVEDFREVKGPVFVTGVRLNASLSDATVSRYLQEDFEAIADRYERATKTEFKIAFQSAVNFIKSTL